MRKPSRNVAFFAIVGVLLAGVLAFALLRGGKERVDPPSAFEIPPFTDSPFVNVGPQATYVGTSSCVECHRGNHETYKHTAHSQALAVLDPAVEPPDASFHHGPSKRDYRVYRQGTEFRHEETVRDEKGFVLAQVDLPVKYLIGSGNFCRSYLVEVDGFLHESPLTWYTSRKAWDVSPGYDFAEHWSFERPITVGCLNCHAGRVEPREDALNKFTFHEQAIGCERCHGPGSLHVAGHREKRIPKGDDLTIVQPSRLTRTQLESVCAECHLNGVASVLVRGRSATDFRPGRPLTDYRVDYRFESGSEGMSVVGHIEQLKLSKCYQKSSELSCITCHDPHGGAKPKDPVALFRQQCNACHADKPCKQPLPERLKVQADDNCVACHMPRGDTDIPHVAFTHHRIGKHAAKKDEAPSKFSPLVPIEQSPLLAVIDQRRNLGLAYKSLFDNPTYERFSREAEAEARRLLEGVRDQGLKDPVVSAALAEIHWQGAPTRSRMLAAEALASPDLPPDARAKTLKLLANLDFDRKEYKEAIGHLEGATRIRRYADDWRLLGLCYMLDGRLPEALASARKGVDIRPTSFMNHGALYEVLKRSGDQRSAKEHLDRAQALERRGIR